jgi:hypothetical protein
MVGRRRLNFVKSNRSLASDGLHSHFADTELVGAIIGTVGYSDG